MNAVAYQLVLHDTTGRSVPGTLTFRYKDDQPVKQEAAGKFLTMADPPPTAEFILFMLEGSIDIPLLIGQQPIKLAGISFVSMLGPTLATICNGSGATAALGMEFNMIDSPGTYIGGSLNWQPDGSGGDMQPWCFIGTRKD